MFSAMCGLLSFPFISIALLLCFFVLPRWIHSLLFVAGLICALWGGLIAPIGLLAIALIGLAFAASTYTKGWVRAIAILWAIILSEAAMYHVIPGFQSYALFENVKVSAHSTYYSYFPNWDKLSVGFFALIFGLIPLPQGKKFIEIVFKIWWIALLLVIVILGPAIWTHFVAWDPKFPLFFIVWLPVNLLLVCVVEEIYYRGFVLKYLKHSFGICSALVVSALLFTGIHHSGGSTYMALVFVAGLFYGWAYLRSRRVEGSVFAHILLNTIHFLLFSYPAFRL